jgi:signal transduction histidine kinase
MIYDNLNLAKEVLSRNKPKAVPPPYPKKMISEKQRLIADVSHELRSPLTRMRMNMEVFAVFA